MFSKDKDGHDKAAETSHGSGRRKGNSPPSLISPGLTVSGNLVSVGDVQIDGAIEGDIQCHALTIGKSATTSGNIAAEEVLLQGTHTGNIEAKAVTLAKTARITGDIRHDTLAVESGAVLNGHLINRNDMPVSQNAPEIADASAAESDQVRLIRQRLK